MATGYTQAYAKYRELHDKAAESGTKEARRDKVKAHMEVLAIEREAARDGVILESGIQAGTMPSKRSMQEEYVRKFDDETPVMLGGKETTLRKWHANRLLGR